MSIENNEIRQKKINELKAKIYSDCRELCKTMVIKGDKYFFNSVVSIVEKAVIEECLNMFENNQTAISDVLGINRNTVRSIIFRNSVEVSGKRKRREEDEKIDL